MIKIKLYSLLLSYSDNTLLNVMFFNRQLVALNFSENLIRSEYEGIFVSNHIFFRVVRAVQKPITIWRKIKIRF
jgi:hypothetical protein